MAYFRLLVDVLTSSTSLIVSLVALIAVLAIRKKRRR